jgi:hypothetical protein
VSRAAECFYGKACGANEKPSLTQFGLAVSAHDLVERLERRRRVGLAGGFGGFGSSTTWLKLV